MKVRINWNIWNNNSFDLPQGTIWQTIYHSKYKDEYMNVVNRSNVTYDVELPYELYGNNDYRTLKRTMFITEKEDLYNKFNNKIEEIIND